MNSEIKFLRKDLYDEVWSQPMSKLAKKYHLSNVGLAKICNKKNIPIPGRGYWAKLAHGHKVRRKPLLKSSGTDFVIIHLRSTPVILKKKHYQPKLQIPVNDSLLNLHPMIKEAISYFKTAREDFMRGNRYSPPHNNIHINVTKNLLKRALIIADTIIKELEKKNFLDFANHPSCAVILGERVRFCIEEPCKIIKKKVSFSNCTKYDYEYYASGILRLRIDEDKYWLKGCQLTWTDGKKKRVEDCLGEFLEMLISLGNEKKERSREGES